MDATVLAAVLTFCSTLASAYLKDALPTGGPMPLPEDLCTRACAQLFRMAASGSNSALTFHDLAVCFLFLDMSAPCNFPCKHASEYIAMPTFCHFPKQNARRCADVALFPCPTAGAATPLLFPFPFSAFPCARRSSAPRWPSSVSPCPHDNVLVLRPRPPLSLRVVVVAPPPAHPRARPEECRTAATVHQAADTEQQRQTQRQNQRSRQQQDICRDRRAIRHAICRTAATVHHLNC